MIAPDATDHCDRPKTRIRGRLVVVSHKRHGRLPKGGYSVMGGFAAIKQQFASHVDEMRLCVPVFESTDLENAANYPTNVSVCPLASYDGRLGFCMHLPAFIWKIWHEIGESDVVYAMCPNDMGLLGLMLARIRGRPVFCSIDTDRAGKARMRHDERWLGAAKAFVVEQTVHSILRRWARNLPTYVTGDAFLGDRAGWRQWVKTTVTTDELMSPKEPRSGVLAPLHIVFAGRLSKEKNVPCLLEAATRLVQGGRRVRVSIVGEGLERMRLEELSKHLGSDFVDFLGHVPNSKLRGTRFLDADVLVLPSREERQGKVLLEAMACSVPVVAANAGGIPSVVKHDSTGMLFDPDSPEALAQMLGRIADDEALRCRLIRNGYRLASENTLDSTVASIMQEVALHYSLPVHDVAGRERDESN